MVTIKPLSSMVVGEEGEIVGIDPRVENKLMTTGIVVGSHILVVAKQLGSEYMPASVSIQVDEKIIAIPITEASMILVRTQARELIYPWGRPEIWRPYLPFFPPWRNIS